MLVESKECNLGGEGRGKLVVVVGEGEQSFEVR